MATDFSRIIPWLVEHEIEFVLIDSVAAIAHGSARATYDIDVVYSRNDRNLERIADAIATIQPYLRGAPPGLPFAWDEATLRNGLNFTLTTSLGELDLLGEVAGGGRYEQLAADTVELELFGVTCRCVTLERLIQIKRAAGRPKDLEAIAELQALLEERGDRDG